MTYLKSQYAIERVKPYLDAMVGSDKSLKWHCPEENARKIAYYIYNGIKVAESQDDKKYHNLLGKYKIRVLTNNTIEARIRNDNAHSVMSQVYDDKHDSLAIIEAIISNPTNKKFLFRGSFDEEEINDIRAWAADNKYNVFSDKLGVRVERV